MAGKPAIGSDGIPLVNPDGTPMICNTGGCCAPCDAEFTWTPNPFTPCLISFTDTSPTEASEWLWDFGDGSNSIERHPTHQYLADGTYDVTLTITISGETTCNKTHDVLCGAVGACGCIQQALPPTVGFRIPSVSAGTYPCAGCRSSLAGIYYPVQDYWGVGDMCTWIAKVPMGYCIQCIELPGGFGVPSQADMFLLVQIRSSLTGGPELLARAVTVASCDGNQAAITAQTEGTVSLSTTYPANCRGAWDIEAEVLVDSLCRFEGPFHIGI